MRYARPERLERAIEFLRANEDATILAGGTDIMPLLRRGGKNITALLDLSAIGELRGIELTSHGIRIGAAATIAEIISNNAIVSRFPLLRDIGLRMGSTQIRNMATLGGNMANASPAGDFIPGVIVLDGSLELEGPQGRRVVRAAEFFTGYRKTALLHSEMITAIVIPSVPEGYGHFYEKVGQRNSLSLSRLSVAALFAERGGRIRDIRLSGCSLQPVITRFSFTEKVLKQGPTEERIRAAIMKDVAPVDDLRATAAYRTKVLENIICHRWNGLIR